MDSRLALGMRSPPPEEFPEALGLGIGGNDGVGADAGEEQKTFITAEPSFDYAERLPVRPILLHRTAQGHCWARCSSTANTISTTSTNAYVDMGNSNDGIML